MIPLFTLRLIFGLAVSWCVAPRPLITSGFFRIQMLVTLGLSVLLLLTSSQLVLPTSFPLPLVRVGAGVLAVVSFVGSVLWTLERRQGGTRCAVLICCLSGVLLLGQAIVAPLNDQTFHTVGSSLTAGWLIGGTTAAMLLGHWYLTASGMQLLPLKQLNHWFGAAAVARSVLAGQALFTVDWSKLDTTGWSWLLLRWGGLVGPIITAWLVVQILKYRNTQSATGVLYAATILVFMGEMAAALLAGTGAFRWTP